MRLLALIRTFPLRGADGTFRPFLTRVVPIRDDGGTIVRWFGSNTDVSALKLAEDEYLFTQSAGLKWLEFLRQSTGMKVELRDVTPSEVRAAAQKYMRGVRFAYVGDSTKVDRRLLLGF